MQIKPKSWGQVRTFTHLFKRFNYKVLWLSSLLSQRKQRYKKNFFASVTMLSICISLSFAQGFFFSWSPLLQLGYLSPMTAYLKRPISSEGRSRQSCQDHLLHSPQHKQPGFSRSSQPSTLPSNARAFRAPRYASLTPYSHAVTIRIMTFWDSAFFYSGILNKQTNHTDKRSSLSIKQTSKDPQRERSGLCATQRRCGQSHHLAQDPMGSLHSLILSSRVVQTQPQKTTGNENLVVPSHEQKLEK